MKSLHPGSTASRMLQFFEENPNERLTIDAAAARFSCGRKGVQKVMKRLSDRGLVIIDLRAGPIPRTIRSRRGFIYL